MRCCSSGNGFFIAGPPGAGAVELEIVLGLGAAALVLTGAGRSPWKTAAPGTAAPPRGACCLPDHRRGAALLVFFLLRPR